MLPIGSGRRWWLNQATHSRILHSTALQDFHGPSRWLTSVLNSPIPGGLGQRDRSARLNLRQGASLGTWRQKGARVQAIGPSRGGQTAKVRALTDVFGRPAVVHVTPGNVANVTTAPDVLKRLLAARGCDANGLRRDLNARGTNPAIPSTRSRKRPIPHDKRRYRDRWRIEAACCRLKDFRPVATCYDKLACNFAFPVALAAILAFWC